MSQIKPIRYKLCITNDAVDESKDAEGQLVNSTVEISYDSMTQIEYGGKQMQLSLFGLSFDRKMYEPGHIEAEVLMTKVVAVDTAGTSTSSPTATGGAQMTATEDRKADTPLPSISELRKMFIHKKVGLQATIGEETYELATNYYIHEISPQIEKRGTKTSIYMKLNIYSLDNLMRLDKFSEVYLARQLRGYIVSECTKDYRLQTGKGYGIEVCGSTGDGGDVLQNLEYEGEEFTQPYLVQYNECFYDFVTRIANRCGEFVFFEDGKLHVGLNRGTLANAGDQAPQVDKYARLTYQYIGDGVVDVVDYTHDSVKSENPDPYEAAKNEPKTEYSRDNWYYVKERGIYPDVSSDGKPKKIYNNEYAADEFYMPLYRNQFSKGWLSEAMTSNAGGFFINFLGSLGKPTWFDIIVDNAVNFAMVTAKAKIYGDVFNEQGNSHIDLWEGKESKKAVPFADPERRMWISLRYYQDIKCNEERAQRQTVCVDMGSEVLVSKPDGKDENGNPKTIDKPLRLGEVVKFDGDERLFLVVGIEMHGDQPWQRSYEGYGGQLLVEGDASGCCAQSRLKFHAMPMAENNKFYPSVLPGGVFRHSEPQHAIVVDSRDPKMQGRVRIRYPWQADCKSKKAQVKSDIDTLKKSLDDSSKTDDEKKEIAVKIVDKQIEEQQVEGATPWIRMATPMATRGGGVLFKPEPYDEVLVSFEHGNIERPYVVGTLYSKNTTAPDTLDPKQQRRVIQSPNGHKISFEDPSDMSKLLGGFWPGMELLKTLGLNGQLKIDASSKEEDSQGKDFVLGMMRGLLGGTTITDKLGLCEISYCTHKRKVTIASALGDVSIDALTGISINAPKGDIKICGKNIDIVAGNRITLKSGENIAGPKVAVSAASIAKTVVDQLNTQFGALIDMKFLRSIMEILVAPVNGTTQIKSKSFLVLEAGKGTAEIPVTAYSDEYLKKKNLDGSSSGYQGLQYMLALLSSEVDAMAANFAKLYNEAAEALAALKMVAMDNNAEVTRSIFHDGLDIISDMTADEFVRKCLAEKHFWQITYNWKLGRGHIGWVTPFRHRNLRGPIEKAYNAIQALKEQCDKTANVFKRYADSHSWEVTKKIKKNVFSKLETTTVYDFLDTKFEATWGNAAVNTLDWIAKINQFNNNDDAINYAYFVGDAFAPKRIDVTTNADYTTGVKKFKRVMIYNILGDGAADSPVNEVKFIKKRKIKVSKINRTADLVPAEVASANDVANGGEKWSDYANSLQLDDATTEAGFLDTLGKELMKVVDEKLLTYTPEKNVWKSDVKGQILMSEGTDTISLEHPAEGGVALKASSNTQFSKETKAEASKYISRLLIEIGS